MPIFFALTYAYASICQARRVEVSSARAGGDLRSGMARVSFRRTSRCLCSEQGASDSRHSFIDSLKPREAPLVNCTNGMALAIGQSYPYQSQHKDDDLCAPR
ncbi:hypothetical protein PSAB6_590040 [Paraburkholderia sabiae]|nr:hypothetical protein PSAB6_590040 [Paraburkholderia sabiae]